MRRILNEFGYVKAAWTKLMCDNDSSVKLSKNPILHGSCNNIRIIFNLLRDLAREVVVNFQFCGTQDQLANLLTKHIKVKAFTKPHEEFDM